MSILPRLKTFLEERRTPYQVVGHPEVFTTQEVAAALHRSGKQLAKVVMVKSGEDFVMCVLPAHELIDIGRLEQILGKKPVRLATEEELRSLFPDCEVGAAPPFGNLYGLPVYLDERLTRAPEIYFEAGNHHETVSISSEDYKRLAAPRIAPFGKIPHPRKAA